MSYIRSGSNPEGLYIIGTSMRGHNYAEVMLPNGGEIIWIPAAVFHEVCRRWEHANDDDDVRYRGMRAREVWMHELKCGKVIPESEFSREFTQWLKRPAKRGPRNIRQVEVSYKGKRFWCWRVTWEYIVRDANSEGRNPWWKRKGA